MIEYSLMKPLFFALFALSVVSLSCDKNDNDSNGENKTEIIAQGSWKYDNAGIDQDKNGTIDLPLPAGTIPACATDNTVTFSTNGTGIVDEGSTKCNTGDPQTFPFTWSFANNETTLNIGGGNVLGASGQFKIVELSATKLTLSKDTVIVIPVAIVVSLKH